MRYAATTILFALLFITACDSGSEPDPSITGTWSGIANYEGIAVEVDMQLRERSEGVTGNGTISGGGLSIATDVSGTYTYPDVSLTLSSEGYENMNFSGRMNDSGDRLTGTLNGSGFNDVSVTLSR